MTAHSTTRDPHLEIIVLAAGKGTRMYSELPKVLHPLGEHPLLAHVLATAHALTDTPVHVVYGHGGELVPQRLGAANVDWVLQADQLGTGHAVAQAMPRVAQNAVVLVLYGDVPLIRAQTLRGLATIAANGGLALLTAVLDEPGAYGRIVRDPAGRVQRIVETKDAAPDELVIKEINTGFLAAPAERLRGWLSRLDNANAQGEYYLTDIVALAVADGVTVEAVQAASPWEVMGVNTKQELALLERHYQAGLAEALMHQGVTLRDPARVDIRGPLHCGRDVVIDVNAVFEGEVELGDGVNVGPNNVIRNSRIGAGTQIEPHCVIDQADIGAHCRIGPFARIRPDSRIAANAHIGNFVEVKKSDIGTGSKVNHLSYIGDSTIGSGVNIGAGTITCNYDGANKHRTVIEDDVFVGSDTQLVAPVTVGKGATIGAGSTITRDVPPTGLTLSRSQQKTLANWQRPRKKE